jgi:hypothetical protein
VFGLGIVYLAISVAFALAKPSTKDRGNGLRAAVQCRGIEDLELFFAVLFEMGLHSLFSVFSAVNYVAPSCVSVLSRWKMSEQFCSDVADNVAKPFEYRSEEHFQGHVLMWNFASKIYTFGFGSSVTRISGDYISTDRQLLKMRPSNIQRRSPPLPASRLSPMTSPPTEADFLTLGCRPFGRPVVLQREDFSYYRAAMDALIVVDCKVTARRMCFDNREFYRFAAPRAGVVDKKGQRHGESFCSLLSEGTHKESNLRREGLGRFATAPQSG